jgi:hypothetical protein
MGQPVIRPDPLEVVRQFAKAWKEKEEAEARELEARRREKELEERRRAEAQAEAQAAARARANARASRTQGVRMGRVVGVQTDPYIEAPVKSVKSVSVECDLMTESISREDEEDQVQVEDPVVPASLPQLQALTPPMSPTTEMTDSGSRSKSDPSTRPRPSGLSASTFHILNLVRTRSAGGCLRVPQLSDQYGRGVNSNGKRTWRSNVREEEGFGDVITFAYSQNISAIVAATASAANAINEKSDSHVTLHPPHRRPGHPSSKTPGVSLSAVLQAVAIAASRSKFKPETDLALTHDTKLYLIENMIFNGRDKLIDLMIPRARIHSKRRKLGMEDTKKSKLVYAPMSNNVWKENMVFGIAVSFLTLLRIPSPFSLSQLCMLFCRHAGASPFTFLLQISHTSLLSYSFFV